MKTFTKGILCAAASFLVAGAVLTGIGKWMGAEFDKEDFWKETMTEQRASFEQITNLEIDVGQGEIEILPCGGTQILATVSGRKEKTKMYTENKTLKIQKNGMDTTKIQIQVPKDTVFDQVSMENGVGKISASDIHCQNLNMECGVGKISASNMQCENLNVQLGVGEISYSGEVTKASIENGIGTMKLDLTGEKSWYSWDTECGIGQIRIDGKSVLEGMGRESKVQGQGDTRKKLDLECGIGKIEISFKEKS